jgi:hypothetical protein
VSGVQLKNNYLKKFTTGCHMLDVIQIVLLVFACIACYIAGQVNGAAGLLKLLIQHKVMTEEDFDKFQIKLQKGDK